MEQPTTSDPHSQSSQPALDALAEVLNQHPALNDGGYGQGCWGRDNARLWRSELESSECLGRVLLVSGWVNTHLSPIKTPSVSSYHLKHLAEDHPDLSLNYVSNGEMILALLALGYPADLRDYNPYFGVSARSLKPVRAAVGR